MSTTVKDARSYTELVDAGDEGPYVFSRIFSTAGFWARRRAKKAFKLLKRIDEPLRAVLRPDERVSFLTRGIAPLTFVEWYFIGWVIYYVQQRAIVVTNRRLILLQIDSRMRPKPMRSQIVYHAIAKLRRTVFGNVRITFRNGDKATLMGVPRADRKWLSRVFDERLQALDATPSDAGIEQLCPHCFEPVDGYPTECPSCAGAFKSIETAQRLSLVFPGAGDFYLGHKAFATFEVIIGVIMWFSMTLAVAFDETFGLTESVMVLGFVFLAMHGIDAATTTRIAQKGILPATGPLEPWRYPVAAVLPALGVVAILFSAPAKIALMPDDGVVAGNEMPPGHVEALRERGYLEAAEEIGYFYSAGVSSVLQDGNFFTDDRIVSYAVDMDSVWLATARLTDVVDLHFVPAAEGEELSALNVVPDEAEMFYLILPDADGGDVEFTEALFERWRAARATTSGPWFDGGAGGSPEDAVVVRGMEAATPEEVAEVELWWLRRWLGPDDKAWSPGSREVATDDSGPLASIRVDYADGTSQDFYFRRD